MLSLPCTTTGWGILRVQQNPAAVRRLYEIIKALYGNEGGGSCSAFGGAELKRGGKLGRKEEMQ